MKKLDLISITTDDFAVLVTTTGIIVAPSLRPVSEDTTHVSCQYENGDVKEFYVLNDQLLDCLRAGINAVKFKTPFFLEGEKI